MTEVSAAKTAVIFGILSGIATWGAISYVNWKYPNKQVTLGSSIATIAVSVIATFGAVIFLREAKEGT